MNQLAFPKQVEVIAALTEGCSIRATERLTAVNRNTIMRLSCIVGSDCDRLHHATMRDLQVACLQLDETWSFINTKQQNLQAHSPAEHGDCWLWLALDAYTKVIISYLIGKRTGENARAFVADLRGRVLNRPQIVTDAYAPYADAVESAFGVDVDYVQLNKEAGFVTSALQGTPDLSQATTNHVERCNLTVRTQLRRHTRRTNAHSKKLAHHQAAIALHIGFYHFCRIHETLRVTPAMELGVTDHIWSVGELLRQAQAAPSKTPLPHPVIPPVRQTGRKPFRLRVLRGGKIK